MFTFSAFDKPRMKISPALRPPPSTLRNTTLFRFLFYFAHTTSQVKATAIALAIIVPSSRDHLSLEALSHSKPSQPVPPTKTHSTRLDLSPNRAQKERKMANGKRVGGWNLLVGDFVKIFLLPFANLFFLQNNGDEKSPKDTKILHREAEIKPWKAKTNDKLE